MHDPRILPESVIDSGPESVSNVRFAVAVDGDPRRLVEMTAAIDHFEQSLLRRVVDPCGLSVRIAEGHHVGFQESPDEPRIAGPGVEVALVPAKGGELLAVHQVDATSLFMNSPEHRRQQVVLAHAGIAEQNQLPMGFDFLDDVRSHLRQSGDDLDRVLNILRKK